MRPLLPLLITQKKFSDNRLFGMFHANTPQHNKEVIFSNLSRLDGVVRVVFATVALGMGINLRDFNTIIHYGAPHSIETTFKKVEGVEDSVILPDLLCTGSQLTVV